MRDLEETGAAASSLAPGSGLFATRAVRNPEHFETLMICDPPTATGDEATDILVRFLDGRHEIRPLPAAIVVFRTLGEAWPCNP